MRLFQFLAMQQPEPTARLIRAAARAHSTVVLDMEDALWDVVDEARTSSLKATGRENLIALAQVHPELFESQPIGVRVNRISGPEGERDFEALGRASRYVELDCIVLPKVETERDLDDCMAAIRTHKVACRSVVPIVETRRAMANLDELLTAVRRGGIEWVVYGHYDFALDSGWWPISEHYEPAFWDQVEPLIARFETAGVGYVHPPYFHIHDDAGLARILDRLGRVCRREFGVLAIGLQQASTANRLRDRASLPAAEPSTAEREGMPGEDPLAMAHRIADAYRVGRRPGNGFALDSRTGEFISPHVYLAARDYIRRVADV